MLENNPERICEEVPLETSDFWKGTEETLAKNHEAGFGKIAEGTREETAEGIVHGIYGIFLW